MRLFILCIALFTMVFVVPSMAHTGGHGNGPVPTWRLASGRHVHGTFHSSRGTWVMLEGRHGRLTAVEIDQFAPVDREHFRAEMSAIDALNAPILQDAARVTPLNGPSREMPQLAWIGVAGLLAAALVVRRSRGFQLAAAGSALALGALLMSPSTTAKLMEILGPTPPQTIDSTFAAFKPRVKTRWDATYFYVESNGMPTSMPAMKGITSWQQQVPIPQTYSGANAWSIPLNPVIADVPVSLDTALHTGAVAIAANGIPVFNPENNRGEFSQDIGELDAFGGHCGRADDYHYHIAPVHLTEGRAKQLPIAWALDGYKLFGFEEPDGTTAKNLDEHLGHLWNGEYHYHAIDKKPYMIASMRGKVTVQNDQVMPQPRAAGVRPYLQPLNGAAITDMRQCDTNHFVLRYTVKGKTNFVNYRWDSTGKNFVFNFVKTDSLRSTVTYTRK